MQIIALAILRNVEFELTFATVVLVTPEIPGTTSGDSPIEIEIQNEDNEKSI